VKLFNEERVVLAALLEEWYDEMKAVTDEANGVFREKAKQYDKDSPVWERIHWPNGFVQELRKKTDRVSQLLAHDPGPLWDDIAEELIDIMNYSRMFEALNRMLVKRNG